MKLTILGSGTSHGVPVIACNCKVCRSHNKKDKRNRSSVYLQTDQGKYILVDIGPEFRIQAIKYKVNKVDALLLTHSHADHFHGIDDLRIFSASCFKRSDKNASILDAPPIPVYTNKETIADIKSRFSYFFVQPKEGGGHAKVTLNEVSSSFMIGDTKITPIPMKHGSLNTTGWLFTENGKSIAYLTDCSYIPEESFELIDKNKEDLQELIIDGLREKPHSTHFSFLQAMEAAERIGAKNVWLTHLTHTHSHEETLKYVKEHLKDFPKLTRNVSPAWDGLVLKV
jgi:phosphoribosyl 1,2-cyclic phosphate phosphodiesterase